MGNIMWDGSRRWYLKVRADDFCAIGGYNEKNVSWHKYTLYIERVWEFYGATNEGKARVLVLIW